MILRNTADLKHKHFYPGKLGSCENLITAGMSLLQQRQHSSSKQKLGCKKNW